MGSILLFFLFLLFLFFVSKYYSILLQRFGSYFSVNEKKWKLPIDFFSYFLSFCTLNVFSSLGIFLIHFLVLSFFFEFIFLLLPKRFKSISKIDFLKQCSVIPFFLTLILFIYGFFNIRNIVLTSYEISTTKNLSSSFRILFVSDAHYGTVLEKNDLDQICNELANYSFDVVILGGDIVDENTSFKEMKEIFSTFGNIESKYGTYFIYGNHDRQKYTNQKSFSEEELEQALLEFHITSLIDEEVLLGDNVLLLGREDASEKRKNINSLVGSLDSSKFVILVDHQPVSFQENAQYGVDLMLSGHTHAGQIFPAGYLIKWFRLSDLWYGHDKIKQMDTIVSSGLTGWGYPIRTQEHSEYVIIDIVMK